jgi:WD40-like Beta Propeller Repeat
MTLHDGFDRTLDTWLDETAGRGTPDYLGEVLARTSRTRQRPAWSSLERWLPVQMTLRLVPVPRLAWILVILALIVALAAAVFVVGSQHRLPPPFGLARNGAAVFSRGGDILTVDPATGITSTLVGGSAEDSAPYYSRDGRMIVFLRAIGDPSTNTVTVAVADADGGNVRMVTGRLIDQNWFDWSPDGRSLALISQVDGIPRITIAATDGSGSRLLDLGMEAEFVSWLGPAGDQLIFRGRRGGITTGLFTVRPDGSDLREVSLTQGNRDAYQDPMVSPDGRRVMYASFEQTTAVPNVDWDGMLLRLHVLDLVAKIDSVIPPGVDGLDPRLPVNEWSGAFSPDGTQIAFVADRSDHTVQLMVAASDGSGSGRAVGPRVAKPGDANPFFEFTPDGKALLAAYPGEPAVRLLPLDGKPEGTLPWNGVDLPNVQRLAP